MPDWSHVGGLMDFCAAYYTTQLVRCAFFSLALTGLVMPLRRMLFPGRAFARGLLWSLFLPIPFLGRLKLFYENKAILNVTWRLTAATMSWIWFDRVYMAGVFVAAVYIFGKRVRLRKQVARMRKVPTEYAVVSVTSMNVTPFTVGLFRPGIVVPQVMLEDYSRDELRIIVEHERTHIRLGHLWMGLAWDILRCLLWVNPFLTVFQKQFRADMEDVCDRVCIQGSGGTAREYGLVLLKTLKLLRLRPEGTQSAVTYAGEREFADMKRRICEIAGFRPYRKRMCVGMAAAAVLAFAVMLLTIRIHSYSRCNESRDIMVGSCVDGPEIISYDTGELSRMISYDDKCVYVERESFEDFLKENDAEGEIWIIFGGFYKMPGLAGAAEACVYENDSRDRTVRIPYESIMDHWYLKLLKWL